ncbi:PP2C family protein-serine/threonine phosphatase [Cyanobium gracile]|uniref:Serine phosphatase RsbU, regulator of sigma subunit n=1 Tax=Cyanobium gracile (strain ATCC 27147 / PCC 6307) TaxID=292564 RepID=K9P2F8_CYAGP|nr:SpoIIE family protein phosphatase [Cyanobium gracile]AFY27567.1 serine phosphatase RsbU, regulator of sigma subunit [Cyanobium gracile PCC 6307]
MTRLLLIDDDRVLQRILQTRLSQQGLEVLLAASGDEGLAMARHHQPQIILCDWCMPGMDGLEVCRRLKSDADLAAIFFILLTSKGEVGDRVSGLDAGADDFLIKPVDPAELMARVRAAMRLFDSNQQLRALSLDLAKQKARLEEELSKAADYVRSILPAPLTGEVEIASLFLPSSQLGGDCFDFYWLDDDHLVMYILDVSGHGLASALPSISVHNLLRTKAPSRLSHPGADSPHRRQSDTFLEQPAVVMRVLNQLFQMDSQNGQYFTMWYGVFDRPNRRLNYASAGHPPALLRSLSRHGEGAIQELKAPGMPIGLFPEASYQSRECGIGADDELYLLTDGLFEIPLNDNRMWDYHQFLSLLNDQPFDPTADLNRLVTAIRMATGQKSFPDDASMIRLRFRASPSASGV